MDKVSTGRIAIGGDRDCLGCSPVRDTGKGLPLEGVKDDTHFHDALLVLT